MRSCIESVCKTDETDILKVEENTKGISLKKEM